MEKNKLEHILMQIKKEIIVPSEILSTIKQKTNFIVKRLKEKLTEHKIKAQIFVGGSLAKGTIIKKEPYDVDIFIRFEKTKYKDEELSKLLLPLLKGFKRIHGSRDYFRKKQNNIIFEIVPVIKIKRPEEAKNITDLSFFHVRYVLEKLQQKPSLKDEIILSKAFCEANRCYGAESYIKGLSGYALEVLIIHYGSFLSLLESIAKSKEKIILDPAKLYSNTQEILSKMNPSKLKSPIILVDPTYKDRNITASLSKETFERLKEVSREFLKNPSKEFFHKRSLEEKLENIQNLLTLKVYSKKQPGDIAGTKLKKFFEFFIYNLKKEFLIEFADFNYSEKENAAEFIIQLSKKEKELKRGPPLNLKKHVEAFKKIHPQHFTKAGFIYAYIEHTLSFEEWLEHFLEKNKTIINKMGVKRIEKYDKKH